MSQVIIKVKCPVHLIRFYETLCGGQPIIFGTRTKRYFNRFLNHYLELPPLGFQEIADADDVMKIQLPYFNDKDIRSYTYLPPSREKLFVEILDDLDNGVKLTQTQGKVHFAEAYSQQN